MALATAVSLAALAVLATPERALPEAPTVAEWAVHVALFFGGAVLWTWAAPERWAWVLAVGAALALGTEAMQHCCIAGRGGEWQDALADAAGLVAGVGLGALVGRRRQAARSAPGRHGLSG